MVSLALLRPPASPIRASRETILSYYGPLSLILLLVVWAAVMVFGFAFIYFAIGSPFNDPSQPAQLPH